MSKYLEAANWVSEQRQAKNIFQNFNEMFGLESFEDAYFVQDALEAVWAHKGDVTGYKLALTSKAMQNMFGVNTPFKGNLFSETILKGDQVVSLKNYGRLGVEFELAIEIGEDFGANFKNMTIEECMSKVSAVYPAFELIDDRKADYSKVNLISTTADNSWNANTVLGSKSQNFSHLDFSVNQVFKSINGNIETSVTGAALENPFNAVIWIADFLNKRGSKLKKGQIVMTGSTFPTYFPQPGDVIEFEVFDIGKIKINIAN
jgi:2-keto-4-pentenoate hydratase